MDGLEDGKFIVKSGGGHLEKNRFRVVRFLETFFWLNSTLIPTRIRKKIACAYFVRVKPFFLTY